MALHLFHLTPENELAKAAVVSRIKQGRAKHVIFDYGTKDESECGCIPVVIERDIEKQWCFTIGNDCNSDLFLPIPGGTRIDCKFYFIESFYEPDKAHLAFRSRSSNEVKILDPINEEEQRTGKMDLIYQNTRYLERPTQLFIGPYRFAIRMPEKSDESASDIVRKRQVAEKLPENYKETDWRETDFLGKGCSGIVHRVRGMNTGAELARKTITDDAFDISELAEEVALISIFDHKNVMRCVDSFRHDGVIEIFMPVCTMNLSQALREQPDMVPFDKIWPQIVRGLKYLHSNNVVHGDLKPANIMLKSLSKPIVVAINDFGHSKTINEEPNSRAVGTPLYRAPEVNASTNVHLTLDGRELVRYGLSADLFSAGLIGLQLLLPKKFETLERELSRQIERLGTYKALPAFHKSVQQWCMANHESFLTSHDKYFVACLIGRLINENPTKRSTTNTILSALDDPEQYHCFDPWAPKVPIWDFTERKRGLLYEAQQAQLNNQRPQAKLLHADTQSQPQYQ